MITSLQNERVKLIHSLQTRPRTRRKEGKIVLEGARLVRDACQQGLVSEFVLYEPTSVDSSLLMYLQDIGISPQPVNNEVMRHLSDTQQPQGVIGVFPMPSSQLPPELHRLLILDAVRDPGNMGTILRTAGAAGVDAVILSPDCADPYNPKALRGGMGAHFRVPVSEMSWEGIADYTRGLHLYLADSEGELRYDAVDWSQAWALIIGSEAHGAGDEASRLTRTRIYIPMAAKTESLNAAVAAGVILFEAVKHR
jgi:TrmH family RNA methyltransferase